MLAREWVRARTWPTTDIYAAAGIDRPDLSHLDEAYLERLRASQTPHLAIEALRRAIEQTMRRVTRHNVVRQQAFSDRLIELMNRYANQHLTSAQIIAELVAMAREVSADALRGQGFAPPLSEDELAFYDAVSQNEAAVTEMGEGVLATSPAISLSLCAPPSPWTGCPATTCAPNCAPQSNGC